MYNILGSLVYKKIFQFQIIMLIVTTNVLARKKKRTL